MSPHAVNNFVSDLVLMAQAMEQLPQVKAELEQANTYIMQLRQTVQDRELRIIDLKTEAESLHASIRELEVAKDQAETMFLEADDRTTRALEFVKAQFGAAGSLIQALEPPRVVEVNPFANEPKPNMADVGLEVALNYPNDPQVSEVKPIVDPLPSSDVNSVEISTETVAASEGQSAPDPTSPFQQPISNSSERSMLEHGGSGTITSEHGNSVPVSEPTPGPYAGKRYRDIPGYVSYSAWVEGGGTYDNYYN